MTPGRLTSWLFGMFFVLAGPALLFYAGTWWENRPAGWPDYPIGPCPFCVHLGFGDSIGARYASLLAADKVAVKQVATIEKAQAFVTQQAAKQQAQVQTQIKYVYRTIYKEIPGVLTPQLDRSFPVPVGALRVLDAAAGGRQVSEVPDPAGRPDDLASGSPWSTVAAVTANNYEACYANSAQLAGLIAWVRAEQAASQAP